MQTLDVGLFGKDAKVATGLIEMDLYPFAVGGGNGIATQIETFLGFAGQLEQRG
ncbi:hypothetical protein D3C81_1863790 [compost metagenome]